ncbi:MAG: hypothetical protein JWQ35_1741 [Bacteriovoracaceae bacterium]|nr:hypothetical protein [Bacteriovoracaceae bacterium]
MSKFIELSQMAPRDAYRLLIGMIVPRPIGWISTISDSGISNLAPFSFFNMLSGRPPILGFCAALTDDGREKDTLRNVKQSKCFIHNVVTRDLAEAMNKTAEEYSYGVSEFEQANLTPVPGNLVKAFRVKEAVVSMECTLNQIISFGNHPGSGNIVLGEILAVHVEDESLIDARGAVDSHKLNAIARLGKSDYSALMDIFSMTRK